VEGKEVKGISESGWEEGEPGQIVKQWGAQGKVIILSGRSLKDSEQRKRVVHAQLAIDGEGA